MRFWRRAAREEPFVPVLVTGDKAALALARSLLDSAELKYWVKNDLLQDLFGAGRLGATHNFIVGPPQVMVNKADAEAAREILSDLTDIAEPLRPLWLRIWAWLALLSTAGALLRPAIVWGLRYIKHIHH